MAKRRQDDLADMTEAELAQVIDAETKAAAEKARPHIIRAYEAACHAGDSGSFDDWLALAIGDELRSEAEAAADKARKESGTPALSPWRRNVA